LSICSYAAVGTGLFRPRVAYFEIESGLFWNESSSSCICGTIFDDICLVHCIGVGMPEDLAEQRYRDHASECMERAQTASTENVRAMFLQLAQKWLEMANSRFGLTGRSRDRLNSALNEFNDSQMKK
jgi:hypothetical protein